MNVLGERAQVLATLRAFMAQRNITEVQTPLLAPHTVTEPMVDSIEVSGYGFLQTSPEYQMKRLLTAGSGDIYQLSSVFRAGESGRLHQCEFTMLEWYRCGFDDAQLIKEVAQLIDAVLGPSGYQTVSYTDLVGEAALQLPADELDLRFADACAGLEGRHFITHYPAEQAALARLHPNGQTAARFELVVDGVEIANGYHELGDASVLRRRFEDDNANRQRLGKPVVALDEAFLSAMGEGFPDCAGVSVGVDRLVMLATNADHIQAVQSLDQSVS